MPTLSPEIIQVLSIFSIAFTEPAFRKAVTLLIGTILAPGRRTVASALRSVGLSQDPHFTNYHRLLNRDQWSPWILSRLLLDLLVHTFLAADAPLVLIIDETLERRRGNRIRFKSWWRDPVRSTGRHLTTVLGLRWVTLTLLVPVPWSQRPWALPFMVVPALSEATSKKLGKAHRSVVAWAILMVHKVHTWQPQRAIVLISDGTYAATDLVEACQRYGPQVRLVTRLRHDAKLHGFPKRRSKFGRMPKKGNRQASPAQRFQDHRTRWRGLTLPWYGGHTKKVQVSSGISLWAKRGATPVPLRWVLVRCPQDPHFKPEVFCCSDPQVSVKQLLIWVVARWNIEVTFEEVRAHLGFETQREWSVRAIERTTPGLFGTFSLVVVLATVLYPETLPVQTTSWYPKTEATFSDVLAAVRRQFWKGTHCDRSEVNADLLLISKATLDALVEVACYTA
jgi:hypothetical protein